jgi:hypothetical protein
MTNLKINNALEPTRHRDDLVSHFKGYMAGYQCVAVQDSNQRPFPYRRDENHNPIIDTRYNERISTMLNPLKILYSDLCEAGLLEESLITKDLITRIMDLSSEDLINKRCTPNLDIEGWEQTIKGARENK